MAAVAIAMITGCGGGDGLPSTSGSADRDVSAVSKPEFIFSADTICMNERKGTGWRADAYRKEHRSEGLQRAVLARDTKTAVLLETAEAEIAGIRRVPRPTGDEEEIKDILDAMQAAVIEARSHQVRTPGEAVKYLSRGNENLLSYGLGNCAHFSLISKNVVN